MRLGIDFGTTRTVVAAAMDGRYPSATFDLGGVFQDYLPSHVARRGNELVFGPDATRNPANEAALSSIKRAVSELAPDDEVDGLGVSALELVTNYLEWVRRVLIDHSNLEVRANTPLDVTVAVPANASTRQRFLTIEAFKRADFSVIGLVNEPTAAAIEFAYRNTNVLSPRSPRRYVVVYDLGGGTFDTAAVSLQSRRFELLTSRGISRLGGADFDGIILQMALESAGVDPANVPPSTLVHLLDTCREAKESLTPSSRKLLVELAPLGEDLAPVVLDLRELFDRCRPLIERTIAMVDDLFDNLAAYDLDAEDTRQLGGLYLVGGASAFVPLCKALRARYKRKIQLAPQPHAATAIGLAIASDPNADIFVREAMTRYFGVWREAERGRDKVFDSILSKDTLPAVGGKVVVHRHYRPSHSIGHLRFLECSDLDGRGQPIGDVTPWNEVRFPYDPKLIASDDLDLQAIERCHDPLAEDIVETYTHDRDGTIAVTIENRTHGYRREYVLGSLR